MRLGILLKFIFSGIILITSLSGNATGKPSNLIISCSDEQNDLILLLSKNGYQFTRYPNPLEAVTQAAHGTGVLILADDYPFVTNKIDTKVFELAKEKDLKLYVEFSDDIPGVKKSKWNNQNRF